MGSNILKIVFLTDSKPPEYIVYLNNQNSIKYSAGCLITNNRKCLKFPGTKILKMFFLVSPSRVKYILEYSCAHNYFFLRKLSSVYFSRWEYAVMF
jgi:hypothetical protein